jgi:hypothetical protein
MSNKLKNNKRIIFQVVGFHFQRLLLIFQLKKGLPVSSSETVFNALVLGKILYALPMFYNFLSEYNENQIRALFKEAKRWRLDNIYIYDLDSPAEKSFFSLFRQCTSAFHFLNLLHTCSRLSIM